MSVDSRGPQTQHTSGIDFVDTCSSYVPFHELRLETEPAMSVVSPDASSPSYRKYRLLLTKLSLFVSLCKICTGFAEHEQLPASSNYGEQQSAARFRTNHANNAQRAISPTLSEWLPSRSTNREHLRLSSLPLHNLGPSHPKSPASRRRMVDAKQHLHVIHPCRLRRVPTKPHRRSLSCQAVSQHSNQTQAIHQRSCSKG